MIIFMISAFSCKRISIVSVFTYRLIPVSLLHVSLLYVSLLHVSLLHVSLLHVSLHHVNLYYLYDPCIFLKKNQHTPYQCVHSQPNPCQPTPC